MTVLLDNVSGDTTSDPIVSDGGSVVFVLSAISFGSATVNLQVAAPSHSPVQWITLDNGSFTASTSQKINYLPNGMLLRAEVTGSSGGEDSIFLEVLT